VREVKALIDRLLAVPQGVPVEESGATALFAAISGHDVYAVMGLRGPRNLSQREQRLLQSTGRATGHERSGALYAGDVPVAATTAVLLPDRVPPAVRATLGIGPDGEALPGVAGVPLGRALTGLGVRRESLEVVPTSGARDAGGRELVIRSVARLWLGLPIAIVTERVYGQFLDAFSMDGART
jgi:hypothetical protein